MIKFSLFRIPMTIHSSFWVLAGLIGWLNSQSLFGTAVWVGIIFVSVLIHELGHAVSSRIFGQYPQIVFGPMGGTTSFQEGALSKSKDFVVVLMGPIFGALLAAGCHFLRPVLANPGSFLNEILELTVNANIFWTVLNLFPVYPLDGGQLMSILLEGIFGTWGKKLSFFLSALFAFTLGIVFFAIQNLFGGVLFITLAFNSYRVWREVSREYLNPKVSAAMQIELSKADQEWKQGKHNEAIERLETLCKTDQNTKVYFLAMNMLCHMLLANGDEKKVYDMLLPFEKKLPEDLLELFQIASFKVKDWNRCLQAGERLYREKPQASYALFNAFCCSLLSDVQSAVQWLKAAKQSGCDIKKAIQSIYFDPIRNDPNFQKTLHQI